MSALAVFIIVLIAYELWQWRRNRRVLARVSATDRAAVSSRMLRRELWVGTLAILVGLLILWSTL